MGQNIGEFVIDLFVNAADGQLTVSKLVQSFGELEVASLGEIAALSVMANQLAKLTDVGIQTSLALTQLSNKTGVPTEAIQRWQILSNAVLGTKDAATQTLTSLGTQLAELSIGKTNMLPQLLARLNVSAAEVRNGVLIYKDASQILGEIMGSKEFQRMKMPQKEAFLAAMVGTGDLAPVLSMTSKQIAAVMNGLHGMTPKQLDSFNALGLQMREIEQLTKQIGLDIASWMAPGLATFFKDSADGLRLMEKILSSDNKGEHVKEILDYIFGIQGSPNKEGVISPLDNFKHNIDKIMRPRTEFINSIPTPGGESARGKVSMTNTFMINGSQNPEATARAIVRHLDKAFSDGELQVNTFQV